MGLDVSGYPEIQLVIRQLIEQVMTIVNARAYTYNETSRLEVERFDADIIETPWAFVCSWNLRAYGNGIDSSLSINLYFLVKDPRLRLLSSNTHSLCENTIVIYSTLT